MNTSQNPILWLLAGALILIAGIILATGLFVAAIIVIPRLSGGIDAGVSNKPSPDASEKEFRQDQSQLNLSLDPAPESGSVPAQAAPPSSDATEKKVATKAQEVLHPEDAIVLFEAQLIDDEGNTEILAIGGGASISPDMVVTSAQTGIEIDRYLATANPSLQLFVRSSQKQEPPVKGRLHHVSLLPPAPNAHAAASDPDDAEAKLHRPINDVALVQIDLGVVQSQLKLAPQNRRLSKNMNRSPPLTVIGPSVQLHKSIPGVVVGSKGQFVQKIAARIARPVTVAPQADQFFWQLQVETSASDNAGMFPRDGIVLNSQNEVVGIVSNTVLEEGRLVASMTNSSWIQRLLDSSASDDELASESPNATIFSSETAATITTEEKSDTLRPNLAGIGSAVDPKIYDTPVYAVLASLGTAGRPKLNGTWTSTSVGAKPQSAQITVASLVGAEVELQVTLEGVGNVGQIAINMKGPIKSEGSLVDLVAISTKPDNPKLVDGLQIREASVGKRVGLGKEYLRIKFETSDRQLNGTAEFEIE